MKKKICLVRTVLTLGFLCFSGVASAALITSFETGDFDGWSAGTPFGSPTVVNSNRASDGVFSTESVFTVPGGPADEGGYGGWGKHTLISRGTADIGITS
ncbi:MAG: hypothetical protein KF688_10765, partial [Pirellulales bacterium]|nr:hypothetical protein [Pirellulales bacterium]